MSIREGYSHAIIDKRKDIAIADKYQEAHEKLNVNDLSNKRCYLEGFYCLSYKDGYLFISIRNSYIEISGVVVHKKGQGTGTKMMRKTIAYICANWPNKKIIWLSCITERLNWYKGLGFIVVKTCPDKHELVYNIK